MTDVRKPNAWERARKTRACEKKIIETNCWNEFALWNIYRVSTATPRLTLHADVWAGAIPFHVMNIVI